MQQMPAGPHSNMAPARVPPAGNSMEIYVSPTLPESSAGPQGAPDPPNTGGKPISSKQKPKPPVIDPNAPLELTSAVMSDSPNQTNNQNEEH
jgi:hypothetical protein